MRSQGARWLHSPFVFHLHQHVIRFSPIRPHIESQRRAYRRDMRRIAVQDWGAGKDKTYRRIADITRKAVAPAAKAAFLRRLCDHQEAHTVIELGTSLGLTTAYLADNQRHRIVHTIEGCPNIHALSQETFQRLNLSNIRGHQGKIADVLPPLLETLPVLDVVFLDAHHAYTPTLRYFDCCLPKLHRQSLVIVDDLYWSPDMTRAWHTLCAHPSVCTSVDLFAVGLLFFDPIHPKQHFILRNKTVFDLIFAR